MQIKRYTIASFILMAFIGWYIYAYITQDTIGIDLFGIHLPALSIAAWVVASMFVLYLASVFHMFFYSMLGTLRLRKYDKDFEKFIDSIVDAYLGKKNRNHIFKTDRYKLMGSLIDNTELLPNDDLSQIVENEKIKEVLETINKIKNGEIVELKKYSLDKDSSLVIQNIKNKFNSSKISAEDILNNSQKYNVELCKFVYIEMVKTSPMKLIEKHSSFLTKEALFEILSRINTTENSLDISNDVLKEFLNKLEFDEKDYIDMSRLLSKSMVPDQRIALFEILSNDKEEVMSAYLYTLFDLEMLELANEILQVSQESEYLNFKAYRALKDNNQNFNIDLFIS